MCEEHAHTHNSLVTRYPLLVTVKMLPLLQKKMEINLLRTLLIIFIIYYIGRLFTRYILPALFYNYMDDKMSEFARKQKKQRQHEQQQAKKKEGEVTIDYAPNGTGKNKPSKGEYVDYEEVK